MLLAYLQPLKSYETYYNVINFQKKSLPYVGG